MWIDKNITQKKRFLSGTIKKPMMSLIKKCIHYWNSPTQLSKALYRRFDSIPCCQSLYCIDVAGNQISGDISKQGIDMAMVGESLQDRPFFQGLMPYNGLALSSIYICLKNMQPCITALYAIKNANELLGFLAADFYMNHMPKAQRPGNQCEWAQYKGDPSIRSTVFMQQRTHSRFDERLDRVIYLVYSLLKKYGVFHTQVDLSSSRLVTWSLDTPFEFQVLSADELFSGQLTRQYRKQSYPSDAVMPSDKLMDVLAQFKSLRQADETIYLRTGTINTINDTVGLTFSCDGYHLMSSEEFLSKDIHFWIGNSGKGKPNLANAPLLESA